MRFLNIGRIQLTATASAVLLGLAGCGGGTGQSQSQGVFLDAAVTGVSYSGDKGTSGITATGGTFNYYPGENITFSIGSMVLGTAPGAPVLTPVALDNLGGAIGAQANRVLRTLQTLDSDDDPSNGITISAEMRGAVKKVLHLSNASEVDLLSAVQQARPAIAMKSEADSLQHFAETLVSSNIVLKPPVAAAGTPVTFTLMHTNDTHSRMESFTDTILQGGVARRKTLVDQARTEIDPGQTCKNQMLVDAGDFSQGTVYYNAWEGSESVMAMNAMSYDVVTLGNHEFDLGPAKLARALKGEIIAIAGTDYPTEKPTFAVVASNIDATKEPALKGLLKKFTIIERCGQKYGVIAATTEDVPLIASPGANVKFLDYVKTVNASTALLKAQGINKIILLSHYGYSVDIAKAAELSGVDIIVSGHDHKLLGTADYINTQTSSATLTPAYVGQGSLSSGAYPTQLTNRDGDAVLVVSAFEWGRWLGRVEVNFDANGKVLSGVNKSKFVDGRSVAEDSALAAKVATYYAPVQASSSVIVGTSGSAFPADRGTLTPAFTVGLRTGETTLGNLAGDLLQAAAKSTDGTVAAFTNGGGLRAAIPAGTVTFGTALSVLPFGNTLYVMDLTGQDLIDLMEASASKVGGGGFLQHSKELRMTYCADALTCTNPLKTGGKVTSVQINGVAVETSKRYRVATNNFTAGGGDGYDVLKNACLRTGNYCRDTGIVMLDLLVNQLKTNQPLSAPIDGRITRL
jgi:5'-nucleotidase